jgi:hypothetical protein
MAETLLHLASNICTWDKYGITSLLNLIYMWYFVPPFTSFGFPASEKVSSCDCRPFHDHNILPIVKSCQCLSRYVIGTESDV